MEEKLISEYIQQKFEFILLFSLSVVGQVVYVKLYVIQYILVTRSVNHVWIDVIPGFNSMPTAINDLTVPVSFVYIIFSSDQVDHSSVKVGFLTAKLNGSHKEELVMEVQL